MKLSLLLTVFLFYACHAAHVHRPKVKNVPADGFALAANNFGIDLLKQFGQNNPENENIFFSPYSVSVILSAVYQGANGQSSEELKRALRFDSVPTLNGGEKKMIAESIYEINQKLKPETNQTNQLDTANLIALSENLEVNPDYIETVSKNYDAKVVKVDFVSKAEETKRLINEFVSNKTHGLINPMLEGNIDPKTRLALINAVYFKGEWLKKFDPEQTETGVFYGANGQQYPNVQYMNVQGPFPHTDLPGLNADMVMIKYKGEDVAFVAILPRDRDADISQIRKQLNASFIDERLNHAISFDRPTVYLPRMEVTTKYDLMQSLKELGVQGIFGSESDLSGIAPNEKLKVTKAIHKAKMILNEEGTEAGASTYIEIQVMSINTEPLVFRFDHPFLYFIRHQTTGQILFLGEAHKF